MSNLAHFEQPHYHDQCKTADDVKAAAFKVMARRMALRAVPRPKLFKLIERAEVVQVVLPEAVLEQLPPEPPPYQISIRHIQKAVAHKFGVEVIDLLSERKNNTFTVPRHVTFVLCRLLTLRSFPEIGRRTGNRDHTTVLHGVNKYQWLTDQLRAELKQTDFLSVWVTRAHELVNERAWSARAK